MPDWETWGIGGAITLVAGAAYVIVRLLPWNSLLSWSRDRHSRRSEFITQRIEPVEQFSQVIFELHDRLTGILSMWGPDAPYDERTHRRAMDLYDTLRRDLTRGGIAAREAARRVDPDLAQRVQDMEAESANLVARLENSPTIESSRDFPLAPIPMRFFIERNDKALARQQKVVDRIRELLS